MDGRTALVLGRSESRSLRTTSCCLMGRENAHSHRAGHVSVAAWGGRGGHSCISEISLGYGGAG